jgi:hypothetical protein
LATKELGVALQLIIEHYPFHQGIFYKNNMTIGPQPTYFSLFPQLKIKLKGRHFATVEVIEAGLQAVLNTVTEHDFEQDEALGPAHMCRKGLRKG